MGKLHCYPLADDLLATREIASLAPLGKMGQEESPANHHFVNEPCWTRTNDHRIESAFQAVFCGDSRYWPMVIVLQKRGFFRSDMTARSHAF